LAPENYDIVGIAEEELAKLKRQLLPLKLQFPGKVQFYMVKLKPSQLVFPVMSEIDKVLAENLASMALEPAGENVVDIEVANPIATSEDINLNEDSDLNRSIMAVYQKY